MGVSTNGILFFGFEFFNPEEDTLTVPWLEDDPEGDQDWMSFVALRMGVPPPPATYEGNEAAWRTFWEQGRTVIAQSGCMIDVHCSGSFPLWYVCVRNHRYQAGRGYLETIDPASLVATSGEIEQLRQFCTAADIPWQPPAWHLASYWSE